MMFLFLIGTAKAFGTSEFRQCPGQAKQYFQIKKFDVSTAIETRGMTFVLHLIAELNHKVQEPYLEIQLANGRIPYTRKIDQLCRPGILICPASFSQVVYAVLLPVPATIPIGDYTIRMIFREGSEKLGCYESTLKVNDIDIEQLHREEYARSLKREYEAHHDETEEVE
ncbi:hypothetical protein TVAG_216120 [Trichomonas vaginalis G3]|uniref:MD-2-related lipid-recognition domain-containing protein n=1 Tax=Trichomonas vaginalis (strain ATCC PRA-98 / G3) TaxID=412133 RepID=A2ENU6_TRIV3|nr:E set domains family [Trichomonas vaginalis G3]EAY05636.1 hypothetical protein TVAG_216120 [Trichomonas vaginalis G3]KAI5553876.1 E set domains family [Trichomonas vaginalis G3]|eukprot:XP_001317859.1 hypothetical protein [Trichomonas vaginalis G3]